MVGVEARSVAATFSCTSLAALVAATAAATVASMPERCSAAVGPPPLQAAAAITNVRTGRMLEKLVMPYPLR